MIAMLALWVVLAAVGTVVLQRHLEKLDARRRGWNPVGVEVFLEIDVDPFIKAMDRAARALAEFNRAAEERAADFDRQLRKLQDVMQSTKREGEKP